MTDIRQQFFLNEFKGEIKGKDGFSDDVIDSFDNYFNEKFIRGNEKKVIEESLQNNNFITSDVMEAVNSVLYDKQNIGVITKFIGKYNDNDNYNHNPTAEYFNNQYTGYTTNNGKPLLVRIKNSNQTHYTADLIDVDGNVIYNIDSNRNSIEDDKAYIGTQINNNCCIHAFEQTLMLQDLVQFYHNKKITRPALKEFIKKAIEKLKEDGVFEKKEEDADKNNSNSHFTKLRKEICKIYALTKFLDSKEKELRANGNYDKIKNYRNTLYDKLLDEKSKVNFANYLDFKNGLEQYNNKLSNIDKSITDGDDPQLKEDKDAIKILQFLNKAPDSLKKAEECIKCFGDLGALDIGKLDNWKLKIFIEGASDYICRIIQTDSLLKQNLDTVKQLYELIKEKDKIKNKPGDDNFNGVSFNLKRALTYIELLTSTANDKKIENVNNESIEKLFNEGGVIEKNVDGDDIKCEIIKKSKVLENNIVAQLKSNTGKNNFDFINIIEKDVYVKNQLTQEEFNEILNNDNFKTIAKEVGEDANFLFYNKLKSLGIVNGDVSVNFGKFKFQKHVNNLFPENSKYCLVDAGNGDDISGGGVNGACQILLKEKFGIEVEKQVKNIHALNKDTVVNCGNGCKAQCVSQDKDNKVTLLKFYKEEKDGKQKDGIFILYVTGPNFSEDENNETPNGYKNRVTKGMQTLENTLNSIMNTISNSSSTLSLNDTIIFGGISNAIYAGNYQDEHHKKNEFNFMDLFNALVYKVKSKDEPPVCNVSFTWGVAKAIDFVNELDKAGKDIDIENDILGKFGFDENDEVYKYLKSYIDTNFNNIFSKAKKAETPKREGEDAGSSSVAPSQSEMGGSTSGSGTPSQSEMGGSTSGSIPTQSSLVGGSSTPSSSISTPSVNTSASNSVIPTSKASASAPSGSIAVNSTQQDFQGPPPPPATQLDNNIMGKLANILIKREPGLGLFNELKNNGIITEEGKLADGQGGNWGLIVEKAKEIYNGLIKGKNPAEELKLSKTYKTQQNIKKLLNYFDNPENVIGKDGSVNFAKVSTNKGNPQNPPKDPVDKPPFSTKLNPVSNKTNKFDEKPSPAKTMGVVPKNQNSPDVILRDLSSKVNELMTKQSGEYKPFEIKHPQGNGLLDYLQKARDNNVELTEEIVNDIQDIWNKKVTIGGKTQTIQKHMGDELVEYISSFSKKNQGLEEHQEPQAQKEEEKQNLETEIKDKQTEINSLIKEIKEDKSIDDEKKLNEKKKKVEKLITELKVSKQKFETDYPDEQNAEIKNINIDNLSNNLNKTVNVISKKLKVEKQQSKTQNTNKEDNKIQQEEGKKEQHSSQQQETKTNNINTNTNTNTTAKLKGTAEQIKKQNELYKFFMIWYCFQMMMMAQQRNNIVQQNIRR